MPSAGIDWQREKWQSGLGSKFIHQGEKNAVKYADEIIVLSKGVQDYFKETYGRETHFIPNGVNRPQIREANLITDRFGLKKDSYILFLGRLVPEKGIRYLVEAFKNVKTDKKLVIAGGSSDTDSFMAELKELAKRDDRILFTGFVQGAMLDELYSNAYIYTLPSDLEGIGKFYTTEDLSYYTKGNQFPELISSNIDTGINTALFPVMSKAQDSIERVKAMARKTTNFTSYVMSPILIGFMAVAEPFISLLLTDKWLPCVPYLRICCIILLFRAPQTAILQAIKAIGRSDAVLKVDVPIRTFAIIVLCISLQHSVYVFALSEIAVTLFGTVLYVIVAKRMIDYSGIEVCHDFLFNVLMASVMGAAVFLIGRILIFHPFFVMVIQVIFGATIYIVISILTNASSFLEIKMMVGKMLMKHKKA